MPEKDTNQTQPEFQTLSIRLSPEGFSFATYHPADASRIYFQHTAVNVQRSMAANVKGFLSQTPELNVIYHQTNILIHTLRYTTVPLELFEDEQMEMLFYQNVPKQNNEIVLCNILGNSNVVVLFSIDKLTHVFLSEHFPRARFFATVSPQIEYFTKENRQRQTQQIYANIHADNMDVFCFSNGRLQLANTYPISTNEDRSYYLLNIWKQLDYDTEKDELHLTGLTKEELHGQISFLRQFIRKIFIINNPQAELQQSSDTSLETIPFDIQSLFICE